MKPKLPLALIYKVLKVEVDALKEPEVRAIPDLIVNLTTSVVKTSI